MVKHSRESMLSSRVDDIYISSRVDDIYIYIYIYISSRVDDIYIYIYIYIYRYPRSPCLQSIVSYVWCKTVFSREASVMEPWEVWSSLTIILTSSHKSRCFPYFFHLPLWDEVKITDREEHWRIRHLKEVVHMLGNSDLLSRPSIEKSTMIIQADIKSTMNWKTSIISLTSSFPSIFMGWS